MIKPFKSTSVPLITRLHWPMSINGNYFATTLMPLILSYLELWHKFHLRIACYLVQNSVINHFHFFTVIFLTWFCNGQQSRKKAFAIMATVERVYWFHACNRGFNLFTDHNNPSFHAWKEPHYDICTLQKLLCLQELIENLNIFGPEAFYKYHFLPVFCSKSWKALQWKMYFLQTDWFWAKKSWPEETVSQ